MKLEEIEKLCKEATPGPWEVLSYSVPMGKGFYGIFTHANKKVNDDDAKFIAASRELVPKLLAVAKAAKEHVYGEIDPDEPDMSYWKLHKLLEELEK